MRVNTIAKASTTNNASDGIIEDPRWSCTVVYSSILHFALEVINVQIFGRRFVRYDIYLDSQLILLQKSIKAKRDARSEMHMSF